MMIRVLAVVAALTASCAWLDDGPPTRSCRADRECFMAQGEYCNATTHECETRDASAIAAEAP